MKIGYILSHASGLDHEDHHFFTARFDAKVGFKPTAGETWVVHGFHGNVRGIYGVGGWLTGLWQSPSRRVYVSNSDGQVAVKTDPDDDDADFKTYDLPGTLTGVWGLDDKFVLAWGLGDGNEGTVVYRFNGSKWTEIPSPGEVVSMHGLNSRLVYAVGVRGLIARWDGTKWHKVPSPTGAVLSDVFVAEEEEMYAVGDKVMLQGSTHGWTELLEGPTHMFGVAKWKDQVWVGAAEKGLMKLKRDKLVSVDAELHAERLDARGELLVSSPEAIAFSDDGTTFKKLRVRALEDHFRNDKPMWVR
jgi:hypothetical protein